ncbi:MAG: nuclear transport factor 2 family protein [Calditrichaeota bacterium]|nr:MAG: nuclear transport factor 2 family protein [Calditrichota bacterium]
MSKNSEIVRRAHQAFSHKDNSAAAKLVAEKCTVVDHGRGMAMSSRAEFRGWLDAFHQMSSDMKLVDAKYIDAGEWVTAQFRAVGTQDGAMDQFPASGKKYSLDICEVWRFNDKGEAIEGHNYSDGLGMLIQLGHIQAPAQE